MDALPIMRHRTGFTFLELILAIAILGISLMAVMRAFSLSLKTVSVSGRLTQAVLLAETKLQEMEFNSRVGIPDGGVSGAGIDWNYTISATVDGIKRVSCAAPLAGRDDNVTLVTYVR
jgi:type II secretion system protein I